MTLMLLSIPDIDCILPRKIKTRRTRESELGKKLGEYNFFFDPVDDNSFDCRKVEITFKEGKDKDDDDEEEEEDEGKDDDDDEEEDDDEYKLDESNRVGVRERFFGVFIGRDISAIGETMSVASLSYVFFSFTRHK